MFDEVADGTTLWLELLKVSTIPSETFWTLRPAVFSLHLFCNNRKSCLGAGISANIPLFTVDLTVCVGSVCHQWGGYTIDRAVFCNRCRSIVPCARNKFPLPRQLRISDQSHLEHHTLWRVPEKRSCSSRSELTGSFSSWVLSLFFIYSIIKCLSVRFYNAYDLGCSPNLLCLAS